MSIINFDESETKVLMALAKPLVAEETTLKTLWTCILKIRLSVVLWIDLVAHLMAILMLDENWLEAGLTLFSFLISNVFTYPLIRIR